MLFHQHTIELGSMRGLNLSARLKNGGYGYVMVRDADDPDALPFASRVLGPYYPLVMELRPKHLASSGRVAIFSDEPDCLEIAIEPLGVSWRARRSWRRQMDLLKSLWTAWRSGRQRVYAGWHLQFNALDAGQRRRLAAQWHAQSARRPLRVWVLGGAETALAATRAALACSDIQPSSVAPAAALNDLPEAEAQRPAVDIVVAAGTRLEPWTLGLMALRAAREVAPCLVYGDSEARLDSQLIKPLATTAFDLVRAQSHPGAQVLGVVATNDLATIGAALRPGAQLEALAMQAARLGWRVIHLPAVLSRLHEPPARTAATVPASAKAPELVSLIIPSRDNGAMLERTVASLHARRGGVLIEFILVDHASQKAATQQSLARLTAAYGAKIVRAEGDFNFSRLMNLGRAAASGDYLFSINDDIEAREDGWLGPLLAWLAQPGIGSVGPCLLYPNGSIQHAGVVIGINGFADHVGRGARWDDPHLPALLRQTRSVSAVTGAVLGTRAQVWDSVGGWNENLTVEFNDTDFCLKIGRLGLRNVYVADSVLIHHESVSRGDPKLSRQWPRIKLDRQAFASDNCKALSHDPWYPANLTLRNTRLRMAQPPRRLPLEMLAQAEGDVSPPDAAAPPGARD